MSIFTNFLDFFNQQKFSDVTIRLTLGPKETTDFHCHSLILSYHSAYFMKYFQDSKEKPTSASGNPLILVVEVSDKALYEQFPKILEYLYGKKLDILDSTAFPLLALARKYEIDTLSTLIYNNITNNIQRATVLHVLKDAIAFNQIDIKDKCIAVTARYMQTWLDANEKPDLNWLPAPDIIALLSHPMFCLEDEYSVYRILKSYIRNKGDGKLSSEEKYQLCSTIRIPYLKYLQLEKVIAEHIIPEELLSEGLMFRLANFEKPNRDVNPESLPMHLRRRAQIGRIFEYKSDLDANGVIYFLSTNGGKAEWKNSSLTGAVKLSSSSIEKGKLHTLVEREPAELWTKDVPSSWLAIDLRQGRLLPTQYTLRHGGNSKSDALRTWLLQASNDGTSWDEISRHQNDTSLNGGFATKTWKIDLAKPTMYRYFRILQTGHNSGNNNFLALSHFELYGEFRSEPMTRIQAQPPPPAQAPVVAPSEVPVTSTVSKQ